MRSADQQRSREKGSHRLDYSGKRSSGKPKSEENELSHTTYTVHSVTDTVGTTDVTHGWDQSHHRLEQTFNLNGDSDSVHTPRAAVLITVEDHHGDHDEDDLTSGLISGVSDSSRHSLNELGLHESHIDVASGSGYRSPSTTRVRDAVKQTIHDGSHSAAMKKSDTKRRKKSSINSKRKMKGMIRKLSEKKHSRLKSKKKPKVSCEGDRSEEEDEEDEDGGGRGGAVRSIHSSSDDMDGRDCGIEEESMMEVLSDDGDELDPYFHYSESLPVHPTAAASATSDPSEAGGRQSIATMGIREDMDTLGFSCTMGASLAASSTVSDTSTAINSSLFATRTGHGTNHDYRYYQGEYEEGGSNQSDIQGVLNTKYHNHNQSSHDTGSSKFILGGKKHQTGLQQQSESMMMAVAGRGGRVSVLHKRSDMMSDNYSSMDDSRYQSDFKEMTHYHLIQVCLGCALTVLLLAVVASIEILVMHESKLMDEDRKQGRFPYPGAYQFIRCVLIPLLIWSMNEYIVMPVMMKCNERLKYTISATSMRKRKKKKSNNQVSNKEGVKLLRSQKNKDGGYEVSSELTSRSVTSAFGYAQLTTPSSARNNHFVRFEDDDSDDGSDDNGRGVWMNPMSEGKRSREGQSYWKLRGWIKRNEWMNKQWSVWLFALYAYLSLSTVYSHHRGRYDDNVHDSLKKGSIHRDLYALWTPVNNNVTRYLFLGLMLAWDVALAVCYIAMLMIVQSNRYITVSLNGINGGCSSSMMMTIMSEMDHSKGGRMYHVGSGYHTSHSQMAASAPGMSAPMKLSLADSTVNGGIRSGIRNNHQMHDEHTDHRVTAASSSSSSVLSMADSMRKEGHRAYPRRHQSSPSPMRRVNQKRNPASSAWRGVSEFSKSETGNIMSEMQERPDWTETGISRLPLPEQSTPPQIPANGGGSAAMSAAMVAPLSSNITPILTGLRGGSPTLDSAQQPLLCTPLMMDGTTHHRRTESVLSSPLMKESRIKSDAADDQRECGSPLYGSTMEHSVVMSVSHSGVDSDHQMRMEERYLQRHYSHQFVVALREKAKMKYVRLWDKHKALKLEYKTKRALYDALKNELRSHQFRMIQLQDRVEQLERRLEERDRQMRDQCDELERAKFLLKLADETSQTAFDAGNDSFFDT